MIVKLLWNFGIMILLLYAFHEKPKLEKKNFFFNLGAVEGRVGRNLLTDMFLIRKF